MGAYIPSVMAAPAESCASASSRMLYLLGKGRAGELSSWDISHIDFPKDFHGVLEDCHQSRREKSWSEGGGMKSRIFSMG